MSDRFYFGSPNDTDSDDNGDSLPFPKPLDRSAFLAADFEPAAFLSSLSGRFQTLEDLQNELKELVQSLNKELVDLVNDNYQDFLSLGTTLAGGEEKVEEARVGLLGFQRDVHGVRDKVDGWRNEVVELLSQKKALQKERNQGRLLLEFADRLEDLEYHLGTAKVVEPVRTNHDPGADAEHQTWSEDWTQPDFNESDDEFDESTGLSSRMKHGVERYLVLRVLQQRFDSQHPFLVAQRERLSRIYDTLRLDLETAIKQEHDINVKQQVIQLRSSLDE